MSSSQAAHSAAAAGLNGADFPIESEAHIDPYAAELRHALHQHYLGQQYYNWAKVELIANRVLECGAGTCAMEGCSKRFRTDVLSQSNSHEIEWHHIIASQCQQHHHIDLSLSEVALLRELRRCVPMHGKPLPEDGPPYCHSAAHPQWTRGEHHPPTACPMHHGHCPVGRHHAHDGCVVSTQRSRFYPFAERHTYRVPLHSSHEMECHYSWAMWMSEQ